MPYLLAVRSDAEAVDFYLQRRDVSSALALAKMSEGRKDSPQFERKSSAERAEEKESKREAKKVEEQGGEATFSLASIINTMNREEDDAARLGNFHAHSGLGTYTKVQCSAVHCVSCVVLCPILAENALSDSRCKHTGCTTDHMHYLFLFLYLSLPQRELVLAVNAQAASQYLTGSRPMHAAAQVMPSFIPFHSPLLYFSCSQCIDHAINCP